MNIVGTFGNTPVRFIRAESIRGWPIRGIVDVTNNVFVTTQEGNEIRIASFYRKINTANGSIVHIVSDIRTNQILSFSLASGGAKTLRMINLPAFPFVPAESGTVFRSLIPGTTVWAVAVQPYSKLILETKQKCRL